MRAPVCATLPDKQSVQGSTPWHTTLLFSCLFLRTKIMKTRQGFVSNSSTTSFLMYGADITNEDDLSRLEDAGLTEFYGGDYGNFIGRSWNEVGDNQTGGEFKAEIEAAITQVCPDATCATVKVAFYNG